MAVRRWLGMVAVGAVLALPSVSFAHGAATAQKSSTRMKGSGQKAGKAGKGGQKGGKKGKGGLVEADGAVTDSWITTKIRTDFVNESTLKGSDINVDTKDAVVTLTGTVASEAGKTRAEQIAKGTQGVTRVVDDLTIKK